MLRLPGLSADTLLQSIQGNAFDHVSAIYHLLADRLESTMSSLPSIQNLPGDYMPDGAHQLEKFGESESETDSERAGLCLPLGTQVPYHATRRHTVGPGDTAHQSPSPYPYPYQSYTPGYPPLGLVPMMHCNPDGQVLPQTNLPLNLPLVQHQPPQNFQIKDQHLLKPPPVMGASNYFILFKNFLFNTNIIFNQLLFFKNNNRHFRKKSVRWWCKSPCILSATTRKW